MASIPSASFRSLSLVVCLLPQPESPLRIATPPTEQKKYTISAVSRCDTLGWKEITMGKKTTAARRAGLFSLPQGEVIFPIPLSPLSLLSLSLRGMASVKACSSAPPLGGWLTLPTLARLSLSAGGRHSLGKRGERRRKGRKEVPKGGRGLRETRQHMPRGMAERALKTNKPLPIPPSLLDKDRADKETCTYPRWS